MPFPCAMGAIESDVTKLVGAQALRPLNTAMEWTEFLKSICIKSKLTTEQCTVLIARLDQCNENHKNVKIATTLGISQVQLERQLGEIYAIFAPDCPELDSKRRGKLKVLKAYLWKQYENHKFEMLVIEQNIKSSLVEVKNTVNSSSIDYSGCIRKLEAVDKIQSIYGKDPEIFQESKKKILQEFLKSLNR